MRFVWLLPLILLAMLAAVLLRDRLPREYNPWAPLAIGDPVTFATGWKLMRLRGNPAYCNAALETSRLDYLPVADTSSDAGCVLTNAVRVAADGSESGLRFNSSFLASCPLAVAYAMFERHSLQPLAEQHFGARVTHLTHLGSYACRNVRGGARRSEHATADAIDIAGFRLSDGRRITLTGNWQSFREAAEMTDEATFLRDLRDGACRFFKVVLGPDYNAAHRDHFHLGMGGFSICR